MNKEEIIKELDKQNKQLGIDLSLTKDKLNKTLFLLDKIKEIVDKAPCLWYVDEELERIDGTIDLVYKEYTGWKDILELLEEIE